MKISVDAGALCGAHKFGTYVVTLNSIELDLKEYNQDSDLLLDEISQHQIL